MKSTQSEEDRKRFNDILDIRSKGLIPPTLQPGQKYTDTDPGTYQWDPNSPAVITAKKQSFGGLNAPERIGIMKDNQTAAAVDKVVKDDQLKNHAQRIQGADRILSQLQEVKAGHIVDTSQFLNDLNTEYVNLLTGSNNTALGKQERTEYRTYAADLANVLQKIKASPESVNSPEIMSQLEKSVVSLRQMYQKNLAQRASLIQRTYAHNPDATRAQQEKIQEMIGTFGQPAAGGGQGLINQLSPQDAQALDWAKQNPSDPRAAQILRANGL
jgi:hypothetical protein